MGRSATVILVEDDAIVRHVLARVLRSQAPSRGLTLNVIAAAGRVEACALDPTEADLLVTDLDLPDGDGLEVASALGLPAVFVSGCPTGARRVRARFPGAPFVAKPCSAADLMTAVAAALSAGER